MSFLKWKHDDTGDLDAVVPNVPGWFYTILEGPRSCILLVHEGNRRRFKTSKATVFRTVGECKEAAEEDFTERFPLIALGLIPKKNPRSKRRLLPWKKVRDTEAGPFWRAHLPSVGITYRIVFTLVKPSLRSKVVSFIEGSIEEFSSDKVTVNTKQYHGPVDTDAEAQRLMDLAEEYFMERFPLIALSLIPKENPRRRNSGRRNPKEKEHLLLWGKSQWSGIPKAWVAGTDDYYLVVDSPFLDGTGRRGWDATLRQAPIHHSIPHLIGTAYTVEGAKDLADTDFMERYPLQALAALRRK